MLDRFEPVPPTLLDRLEALERDLVVTRSELSRLTLDTIATDEIPTATAELFAIVEQTEVAADSILDGCETLDRVGDMLAASQLDASRAVFAATRRIYAACGFQDLTGQRVTKVVESLRAIEAGMAALTGALGLVGEAARSPVVRSPPKSRRGPQPPAVALTQIDVDMLMRGGRA